MDLQTKQMLPAWMPTISTAHGKVMIFPRGVFGPWEDVADLQTGIARLREITGETAFLLTTGI